MLIWSIGIRNSAYVIQDLPVTVVPVAEAGLSGATVKRAEADTSVRTAIGWIVFLPLDFRSERTVDWREMTVEPQKRANR
jgi:hypothetical protein